MSEILIGIFPIHEARLKQSQFEKLGVKTQFKSNEQTCTTGCTVTVELWGLESDLEVIKKNLADEFQKNLAGHEINAQALNATFDPNASEVICQACGAKFAPTSSECPDCGLVY